MQTKILKIISSDKKGFTTIIDICRELKLTTTDDYLNVEKQLNRLEKSAKIIKYKIGMTDVFRIVR